MTGAKQLPGWAAHNIGFGINMLTGYHLLDVDESLGIVKAPPAGRIPNWNRPEQMDPMRKRQKPKRRTYRKPSSAAQRQ